MLSLFQPDVLLPVQYLENLCRRTHLDPERKLMLTVLEDTILCYQKFLLARDRKGKAMFREAEAWIWEEEREWPFSFASICEVLGLDPYYVRQGLLRWREKRLERRKDSNHRSSFFGSLS